MTEQSKLKWYEASIGWGPDKSWFLVDAIPVPIMRFTVVPQPERQTEAEVKTVAGDLSEIVPLMR